MLISIYFAFFDYNVSICAEHHSQIFEIMLAVASNFLWLI